MSWVAELKASNQKKASDALKKNGCGIIKAMLANATAISDCMVTTHQRLVLMMSTNGLQSGLITHGRYSQLVYNAMSVLEIFIRLYMITASVITAT